MAAQGTVQPVRKRVTFITTGGTIEKTYDETEGSLLNRQSNVHFIVDNLRLPDWEVGYDRLFAQDSLYMTDEQRRQIVEAVRRLLPDSDALIIIHGTDTLALTGELLHRELPDLAIPIVLTGAMKPLELRDTDAVQNVIEALLACRLLPPGVYVVMHGRVLRFPGVVKNRETLTFERVGTATGES